MIKSFKCLIYKEVYLSIGESFKVYLLIQYNAQNSDSSDVDDAFKKYIINGIYK